MIQSSAHNTVESMSTWIQELEQTPFCPILVGTGTAKVQGDLKDTFTLYMPDIFPNDYQTFYMIYSVKKYVEDTPDPIPAWASFSRGSGPKVMYVGNLQKLKPQEKEAFVPEDQTDGWSRLG